MNRIRWGLTSTAAVALLLTANLAFAQNQKGGGGRGRGGFGLGQLRMDRLQLLTEEKVQTELKLTADQIAQIKKIDDEDRAARRAAAGNGGQPRGGAGNAGLSDEEAKKRAVERQARQAEAQAKRDAVIATADKLLQPEQLTRVKQIALQVRGVAALEDADVVAALVLTEGQKSQLQTIRDAATEKARALFPQGGAGGAGGRGNANATDAEKKAAADRRAERQAKLEPVRKELEEKALAVLTAEQKTKFEGMKGQKFEIPAEWRTRGGGPGGRRGGAGQPAA